jgi:hypothetical protein
MLGESGNIRRHFEFIFQLAEESFEERVTSSVHAAGVPAQEEDQPYR